MAVIGSNGVKAVSIRRACPEPGGSACYSRNGDGTQCNHPARGLASGVGSPLCGGDGLDTIASTPEDVGPSAYRMPHAHAACHAQRKVAQQRH